MPRGGAIILLFATLAIGAGLDRSWAASAVLGGVTGLLTLLALSECEAATSTCLRALEQAVAREP